MTQLCKIPAVMVTASVIVMTSITWGFLDPTLEPHLRQVGALELLFLNSFCRFPRRRVVTRVNTGAPLYAISTGLL